MFGLYKKLISLAVILVLIGAALFYCWSIGLFGQKGELQIDKTENVVTSVKKISELVSMNYYEEFTIVEAKTNSAVDNSIGNAIAGFFNKQEGLINDNLVVLAKGHIRAGFDLSKVAESDIKVTGDTLYLSLPKAEIIDATINPSDFEVFVEDGTWSHAEVQAVESRGIELLKQHAIEAGVLAKAEQNGIAQLTNMYKAFGFGEVVCEINQK